MKKNKLPESVLASEFYRQSIAQVPGDVFLACVTVYQNAARMTMPVTNPMEYKFNIDGRTLAFADRPENRGMLAVKEFLGGEQADVFPAVCTRLMACSGLMMKVRKQPRFKKFFKPDLASGDWMVAEALLKAFSCATFKTGTMDLDLNSVHAEAIRLFAEDPD